MKIKSVGYLSFHLSFNSIDLITDPLSLKDVGLKLPKSSADIVLWTGEKVSAKDFKEVDDVISTSKQDGLYHISTPGEYELGGLMVRRAISKDYYVLDEDLLRVVYAGYLSKDIKVEDFKNLGDVELLILPIGGGDEFPSFEVLEKIISEVDPLMLILSGFKTSNMKIEKDLKTAQDFVKQVGWTNVRNESWVTLQGAPDAEVRKLMDVVILE